MKGNKETKMVKTRSVSKIEDTKTEKKRFKKFRRSLRGLFSRRESSKRQRLTQSEQPLKSNDRFFRSFTSRRIKKKAKIDVPDWQSESRIDNYSLDSCDVSITSSSAPLLTPTEQPLKSRGRFFRSLTSRRIKKKAKIDVPDWQSESRIDNYSLDSCDVSIASSFAPLLTPDVAIHMNTSVLLTRTFSSDESDDFKSAEENEIETRDFPKISKSRVFHSKETNEKRHFVAKHEDRTMSLHYNQKDKSIVGPIGANEEIKDVVESSKNICELKGETEPTNQDSAKAEPGLHEKSKNRSVALGKEVAGGIEEVAEVSKTSLEVTENEAELNADCEQATDGKRSIPIISPQNSCEVEESRDSFEDKGEECEGIGEEEEEEEAGEEEKEEEEVVYGPLLCETPEFAQKCNDAFTMFSSCEQGANLDQVYASACWIQQQYATYIGTEATSCFTQGDFLGAMGSSKTLDREEFLQVMKVVFDDSLEHARSRSFLISVVALVLAVFSFHAFAMLGQWAIENM